MLDKERKEEIIDEIEEKINGSTDDNHTVILGIQKNSSRISASVVVDNLSIIEAADLILKSLIEGNLKEENQNPLAKFLTGDNHKKNIYKNLLIELIKKL